MDSGCLWSILGGRLHTPCAETHLFLVSFEFPPPEHVPWEVAATPADKHFFAGGLHN